MKRDFDFEEVGKKVPYQVPDGFFEDVQRNVMECVEKPKKKQSALIKFVPVITAAAAVLCAVVYIPLKKLALEEAPMTQVVVADDTWIENMSDEDLKMMNEFTDYDLFMNQ